MKKCFIGKGINRLGEEKNKRLNSFFFLLPSPSSFFTETKSPFPLLIPKAKLSSSPRKLNFEKKPSSSIPSKQKKQKEVQEEEAFSFLGT